MAAANTAASHKFGDWDTFAENWPIEGGSDLREMLGGAVPLPTTEDAISAVRLSATINASADDDHKMTFSSMFTGAEVKDKAGNYVCSSAKELKLWLDRTLGKGKHMANAGKAAGKRGIIYWSGPFGGYFELWDTTDDGFKGGVKGAVDHWDDCTDCCLWEM